MGGRRRSAAETAPAPRGGLETQAGVASNLAGLLVPAGIDVLHMHM